MTKLKKYEVREEITDSGFVFSALEGELGTVIGVLQEIYDEAQAAGYRDIRIDADYTYEYTELLLTGTRDMTDAERNRLKAAEQKRLAKAKQAREQKKERELAELARLKRKYEGDSDTVAL